MNPIRLAVAAVALLAANPAQAQEASRWITLGTQGSPIPPKTRSQPANLLITRDGDYLIDAGDGVCEQLAKANVSLAQIRAVVLSHLHFDHTAGLFGIISLRWQTSITSPLVIYGPPGTKQLVDGILSSMGPAVEAGYAYPGEVHRPFQPGITVAEFRDGASFDLGATHVTAVKNTHYTFPPGSADDARFQSLSFRFATPGRVIAYTGDTGVSPAVEKLATGADLLVSEMIDYEGVVAEIRRESPNMPPAALAGIERHLRDHHLTPKQVGDLARAANVKAVVITHLSGPELNGIRELDYIRGIEESFPGPAVIARDLDEF
jgi:ribonuclease BN (tRNA processing enzyme)